MGIWYSNGKVTWLGRPFKYQTFLPKNRLFQFSDHHSNARLFDIWTQIYHSNTRLVQYSDPLCVWNLNITPKNQLSIHMVFEYRTIQQPDLLHHFNTKLVRYSDLLGKICVCYLFDGIFNLLYFGFRRFCKLDEKMKIFSSFFVPNFVANHSLELVRIADHDLRSSKTDDKRFVHVVQTTNNLPPKINIFF